MKTGYAFNNKNGNWFQFKWNRVRRKGQKGISIRYPYCLSNDGTKLIRVKDNKIFNIVSGKWIIDYFLNDNFTSYNLKDTCLSLKNRL